jgi:hypothetical protein
VTLADLIRSAHRARRRRTFGSVIYRPFGLVAKHVNQWPSMSVTRSEGPDVGDPCG